ncbi:hypothetical protein FB45DRAFT_862218 [Roridomyces roridus]|uniref:Uncharacterized protein n=1 Tax=Roridomyces roridus TaxID=1738132 RepID=A0AAD7FXZ6_9AGAR|nr:hypothetical protein FB45DRAFT_862218 [Roridomyces roridus]
MSAGEEKRSSSDHDEMDYNITSTPACLLLSSAIEALKAIEYLTLATAMHMHPDLQKRSLDRRPLSGRRIAQKAIEPTKGLQKCEFFVWGLQCTATTKYGNFMSDSWREFDSGGRVLRPSDKKNWKRRAFLSVWFFNLDPAWIPTPDRRRIPDAVRAALVLPSALQAIGTLAEEMEFYCAYLSCVSRFYDNEAAREVMCQTPGFWAVFVKAWSFLRDLEDVRDIRSLLQDLATHFAFTQTGLYPLRLEEMVDAAGGSSDDLASLVLSYIQVVLDNNFQKTFIFVQSVNTFVADSDHRGDAQGFSSPGPLTRSFLSQVYKIDPAHPSSPQPALPPSLDPEGEQWEDLVSRADVDRGFLQLHGLHLIDNKRRVWVIPLRTNSVVVYEALVGLAKFETHLSALNRARISAERSASLRDNRHINGNHMSMGSFASKLDGIVLLGRIIPIKLISSLRPMWCLHNFMVILPRQWTVPLLPEFLYGP